MVEPDFAALAESLRRASPKPFEEIVDLIRTRFHGKGPTRFDKFIEELAVAGFVFNSFVPLPRHSDVDRAKTIGTWLTDARRGQLPAFRALLLRWLLKYDRKRFDSYEEFIIEAEWAEGDHDEPQPYKSRPLDLVLFYLDGESIETLSAAMTLLTRYRMTVIPKKIMRIDDGSLKTFLDKSREDTWLFAMYVSRISVNYLKKFPGKVWFLRDLEHVRDKLIILRQFSMVFPSLPAEADLIQQADFIDSDLEPEKLAEDISRAVHKARLSYDDLFGFRRGLISKNDGRAFLETGLTLKMSSQGGHMFLAIIDVDDMTRINKIHGEKIGDEVLVVLEILIWDFLSPRAVDCGRCGDDTFYAVISGEENGADLTKSLCENIAAYEWSRIAKDLHVTCSIGTASRNGDEPGIDLTIRAALAMADAKRHGGNQTSKASPFLSGSAPRKIRRYFS